jgi:hypothetical protein
MILVCIHVDIYQYTTKGSRLQIHMFVGVIPSGDFEQYQWRVTWPLERTHVDQRPCLQQGLV